LFQFYILIYVQHLFYGLLPSHSQFVKLLIAFAGLLFTSDTTSIFGLIASSSRLMKYRTSRMSQIEQIFFLGAFLSVVIPYWNFVDF